MKRTLLTKIFLGFLLFGLFGFLIVATFTSKLSFDKLKHDEVGSLKEAATAITDNLDSHTEERLILSKEEKSSFSYLSRYLESPYLDLKRGWNHSLYVYGQNGYLLYGKDPDFFNSRFWLYPFSDR